MKRILCTLAIFISIIAFANVEIYYVDNIKISKEDYAAIDTTLCRGKGVWTNGDTTTYIVYRDIYARIDTISRPGHLILTKKSDEEIQRINEFLEQHRISDATIKVGETMPDFQFVQFSDTVNVIRKSDLQGKVVLLNFWATWCGPCIQELKKDYLPKLIDEFLANENFVFIPISVNHNENELTEFFESERGREFEWLRKITLWDKNGSFAHTLSNWGSIPVTVVIDKQGYIVLNETGAFLEVEQQERLKEVLATALN